MIYMLWYMPPMKVLLETIYWKLMKGRSETFLRESDNPRNSANIQNRYLAVFNILWYMPLIKFLMLANNWTFMGGEIVVNIEVISSDIEKIFQIKYNRILRK